MTIVYRIVALLLFSLVYIIGLVGNGLLMFIVFRQKNLHTVPNLLVVSLALGDFLFVLFCVPFGAVAYSLKYYPFSTFYCRFENFIINLSLGVSIFSLLALSADRYKIIAKPFSSHASGSSIKLKLIVACIWLLSACLALPEIIYSGLMMETKQSPDNTTIQLIYCWSPNKDELITNSTFMITRQILRLFIYYLMPLILISIFYFLIAKTLLQKKDVIYSPSFSSRSLHINSIHQENHSLNNNIRLSQALVSNPPRKNTLNQDLKKTKQLRTRHKVAKTVLFLCLVFFICWLPKQLHDLYWFIGVLVYARKWNHFWQTNKTLALILTYIYSCINPFALYFLSSTFRHFYKRYLCFWSNKTCCSQRNLIEHKQRRRTQELMTTSETKRCSSVNNTTTTVYYDLNRIKTSNFSQQLRP
ncbi:unnamed protein product [Rotaria magnacalcarata]|uniref:G-protein coupled receptors family 1 profile domain-containing protein n=1 Tax=Rotaria magnacalcarata TaxID=392030 RepID=A0A816NKV0_9BILA|nr:unnamed protein product [Rotaria magnacalcarata]CAF1653565.1 unnamed protein product [Rotaria magnacalcarata]CAF2036071.1 unnamed protein product [Rotaria magnacalcarata]CAF2047695.1 unnamed protein product [Rotaria magnacalcarata]CAF2193359.1 unnamed protein product [Rotaria magnacalcarata]